MRQAERRFIVLSSFYRVGTALSADWMRPWRRLSFTITAEGRTTAAAPAFGHRRAIQLRRRFRRWIKTEASSIAKW